MIKTRLYVLKQRAEKSKVLKFRGWMRELIAMIDERDKRIEGVWETIRNWEDSFAPDPLPYEVAEFVSDLKEELEK